MDKQKPKKAGVGEAFRAAGPYLTMGIQFALMLALCVFVGQWVDERYDTEPAFTLVGGVLGILGVFYHFLKTVMKEQNKPEDKKQ